MAAAARVDGEPPIDDDLRALILDGPATALVAALAPLDEAARADRFEAASEWLEHLTTYSVKRWPADVVGDDHREEQVIRGRVGIAWFALAPKTPLLRTLRKRRTLFEDPAGVSAVLLDRNPPWLDDLAAKILAAATCKDDMVVWQFGDAVPIVLGWVAAGAVRRPEGPAWLAAVHQAERHDIEADPHLLEHELYESLTVVPPVNSGWHEDRLHQLAGDLAVAGELDAGTYADALLAGALATDSPWQTELATRILDEDGRAARAGAYAALAVADVSRVHVFTVLDGLDKSGRLDPAAAIALAPAFRCPTAKWALVVCRVVDRVARSEDPLAPTARAALAEGLSSQHAKVVTAAAVALAELAEMPVPPTPELCAVVASRFADLRPDQQVDLRSVLAAYVGDADPGAAATAAGSMDPLVDEVDGWSSADRDAFGIDAVLDAWRGGTEVPAVIIDLRRLPVLGSERAIEPLADADALARLFLATIGRHASRPVFDQLIDGVHRFAGVEPAEDLLAEVRRRYGRGFADWDGWPRGIARLAGCWVDDADLDYWYAFGGLADGRLQEAAIRTRSGIAGPALATPTHDGGWIDPVVLAERLQQAHDDQIPVGGADAAAAALRVAPDPSGALERCSHALAPTFVAAAADGPDVAANDRPGAGGGVLDAAEAVRYRAWLARASEDEALTPLEQLTAPAVFETSVLPSDLPPAAGSVAGWLASSGGREFEQLADADLPITPPGHLGIAEALCRSKDVAASAAEVLQAASDTGRLVPARLAAALAQLQADEKPAFARAAAFATTESGRGPGPADAAQQVLEHLLLGEWPRSPGAVLDALRAAVIASGRRPSAPCREQLEARAAGSTKTAKQCRALLELAGSDQPSDATYAAALDARIARARRYGAGD